MSTIDPTTLPMDLLLSMVLFFAGLAFLTAGALRWSVMTMTLGLAFTMVGGWSLHARAAFSEQPGILTVYRLDTDRPCLVDATATFEPLGAVGGEDVMRYVSRTARRGECPAETAVKVPQSVIDHARHEVITHQQVEAERKALLRRAESARKEP